MVRNDRLASEAKGKDMLKLPKVTNERPAVQRQVQYAKHAVHSFLCSICGSNHYDLVLYAHALNGRSELAARCRTCTASIALFDDENDFI